MEMLSEKEKTPPSVMTSLPDDVIMECIAPRVPARDATIRISPSSLSNSDLSLRRVGYTRTGPSSAARKNVCMFSSKILKSVLAICIVLTGEPKEICPARLKTGWSLSRHSRLSPYWQAMLLWVNIFVMGGAYGYHDGRPSLSSIALCIDCRTHTARLVADMPVVVRNEVCKVIDEKIYVVGKAVGRPFWDSTILMVFDSRTETWEHGTKPVSEVDHRWLTGFSWAAGKDTISLGKCLTDEIMHYRLRKNECVMGNILYVYDGPRNKYILRTYDLKQRTWGVVKGLEKLPLGGYGSHIVCCGKTLILFSTKVVDDDGAFVRKRKIWCVEITVEGREDGEIWGKVECCDLLLDGRFAIWNCSAVTL